MPENFESTTDRACIIGAGSSGIAAAKELHAQGIPFDCFELSDQVGGNWVFQNVNGVSSSYSSLHINTSRERMEYSDYPMPKSYPDFPRHDHIAAYFNEYVDHFGFRDDITFGVGVDHVSPRPDGGFDVRLTNGEERVYSHVIVANGHHWDKRMPEPPFPGSEIFEGEQIHSHDYKEEAQLAGKDVVVLGVGNSGMDIAVDASYHAKTTYLAHRRGAYVVPKYVFGKPVDQIGGTEWLPGPIRFAMLGFMIRLVQGRMEDYGLKKPDHRFAHAHPTISGRILDRLSHGAIIPKPNIEALGANSVRFEDGSEVHADLVVYCTGYKITFPFFDPEFFSAPDNRVGLFKMIFPPRIPNLYFIGLVQPLGAVMPIAERQSKLIAADIEGRYARPSPPAMENEISARMAKMQQRYVRSKRHTIQVDYDDYMKELQQELERAGASATPPRVAA